MMDMVTHWMEIAPLSDKTSLTVALTLDEYWFCRYPRPSKIIHDQGPEFRGDEFQEMLRSYGVQTKPTSVENPQANAILERVHQVIGNMVRTRRANEQNWTEVLPMVAFAIRATYHTTLKASPAQLVFGRDMISDVEFTAQWNHLVQRKNKQTALDNAIENSHRLHYNYMNGDKVLVLKNKTNLAKLAQPTDGPFKIVAVHQNGTLTINRGTYHERINIRRVKPYFDSELPQSDREENVVS
jgi:hypothetical protein